MNRHSEKESAAWCWLWIRVSVFFNWSFKWFGAALEVRVMWFDPWCVVCGSLHCMTKILIHMHSLASTTNVSLPAFELTNYLHLLQGPGSFLASPIRDSPGPLVPGGPHDPLLPPGPHGRLPPPGPYRGPRPGPYHLPPGPHGPLPPNVPPHLHGPPLPANGHPGIPMGGEYGPRPANGHAFPPRPGPGHMMDPRGPLPPHFRPLPPHHYGPMPPGTYYLFMV